MDINKILNKYSDPTCINGTDKTTTHSYGGLYVRFLSPFVEKKDNIKFLEIGVYSGFFLQLMNEILPHVDIYGIDINLGNCKIKAGDNPKIHLYELNGTSPNSAEIINQNFDLIIDDASHTASDQLKSLEIFSPYLKQGGVYIIEDINLDSCPNIKQELETFASNNNLQMEWHDLRHIKNRFDDVVAVFIK